MRMLVFKNDVWQAVDAEKIIVFLTSFISLISLYHRVFILSIFILTQKIFDKRDKKEDRARSWSEEIQYIEKGKGLLEQRDTGRIKERYLFED